MAQNQQGLALEERAPAPQGHRPQSESIRIRSRLEAGENTRTTRRFQPSHGKPFAENR